MTRTAQAGRKLQVTYTTFDNKVIRVHADQVEDCLGRCGQEITITSGIKKETLLARDLVSFLVEEIV